jgi:colanic acid/amylovoran biosynthesis glycosyltransferase
MGIDLSRFVFSERTQSFDGEFRLLTVARLVEVKGIEFALLAIASVKAKVPGIRYQIIGDGPLRNELEALTNRLNIADKVEFLGALPQEEVIKKLLLAHIFILPSIVTISGEEENQSVALAEAQASGLPVITTAIGGNAESVRGGESGLLVAPRNSEALASAVLWLADHPESWGRMGRAGRAHVETSFNHERLNDQLIDIYRSAT